MRCNTDPSFVGLEGLIRTHAEQIAPFEGWAAAGDWERFHRSHYDWWVFPVDRRSSWGLQWTVYEGEVARPRNGSSCLSRATSPS